MLNNLKILAVDDHTDTLAWLEMELMFLGARVVTSTTVEQALRIIEGWQPDVLLCDIMMPDKDGLDLMRELKKYPHRICAIALSAYVGNEIKRKALELGFRKYLVKPVEPIDIANVILAHCQSPAPSRG